MIVTEEKSDVSYSFDFGLLAYQKEEMLFFDIETTGLSASKANLYLIGTLSFSNEAWILTQFFAESIEDEQLLLRRFSACAAGKRLLLSFNGDRFDIPFLDRLYSQYHIQSPFAMLESLDILKIARPLKQFLRLGSCRLKSCEEFLGIYREDAFSGGELIPVYYEYLKKREESLLHPLLLHNAEDLKYLPSVLPILSYSFLFSASFERISEELLELPSGDGMVLDIRCKADTTVPRQLDFEEEGFTLNVTADEIELVVRTYQGELKYFFPDYKNYRYLPLEDMAVHKSVADFMDPSYCQRATARTAYQKRRGIFLPVPLKKAERPFAELFVREYGGKDFYVEYNEGLFRNAEKLNAYVRSFLLRMRQGANRR